MVALVAFFNRASDATGNISPVTQTLLSNFTSVVGVVVAFYFGSSALMQMKGDRVKAVTTPAPTSDRP